MKQTLRLSASCRSGKPGYPALQLLLLFSVFAMGLNAQTPCAGAPGSNTVMPLTHTVCAGSAASMSLANSYSNTGISYQWYSSSVSSAGPFSAIPGATLSAYTSAPLNASMYYQLVITCGTDNSSITLYHTASVVSCAVPCSGTPATTGILPATQTLCAGDAANLSLSTTYTDTGITYHWGSSAAAGGPFAAIPGATLSTYAGAAVTTNTYYSVSITCTNSGASYSTTAAVAVTSCTYCSGTPGSNTVLPVSQTVCAGSAASMSLANTYTASGISYQWQSSSLGASGPFSSIPGATLNSYTSGSLNATTYYNVVIACSNSGQSISVPYSVVVMPCNVPCSGTPSSNTILPVSHTLCAGNPAVMSLAATYTSSGITYQWGASPSAAGSFTPLSGATSSTFTSNPLLADAYFNITITCTNSGLSYVTTHSVSVHSCTYCSGTPAGNSILPPTYTLCAGNVASLSLSGTYTVSGITYQWEASSTSASGPFTAISGANSNTYTSPPLTADMHYQAVITCTNSGISIMPRRTVSVLSCTSTTGMDHLQPENYNLFIYPNPNTGEFTIRSQRPAEASYTLVDVTGRTVLSGRYAGTEIKLDLNGWSVGIYYLLLRTDTGTKVIKVFKE